MPSETRTKVAHGIAGPDDERAFHLPYVVDEQTVKLSMMDISVPVDGLLDEVALALLKREEPCFSML
jgi:hypothetical protein